MKGGVRCLTTTSMRSACRSSPTTSSSRRKRTGPVCGPTKVSRTTMGMSCGARLVVGSVRKHPTALFRSTSSETKQQLRHHSSVNHQQQEVLMYDVNTIRGRCYAKYFTIKAQKEAIDKLVATFAIRGEVIRTKNVRSVIQQVERKTKLDYCK